MALGFCAFPKSLLHWYRERILHEKFALLAEQFAPYFSALYTQCSKNALKRHSLIYCTVNQDLSCWSQIYTSLLLPNLNYLYSNSRIIQWRIGTHHWPIQLGLLSLLIQPGVAANAGQTSTTSTRQIGLFWPNSIWGACHEDWGDLNQHILLITAGLWYLSAVVQF